MIKQAEHPESRIDKYSDLINGTMVAEASIQYGSEWVDPILKSEFMAHPVKGTICDLGCGTCTRLVMLCELTGSVGIGIDSDKEVVEKARTVVSNANGSIEVLEGDISNLEGVWEDVSILMQNFVFHDFVPDDFCTSILNSYLNNFPNLQYFYYVDIVSPSSFSGPIFPGFDYVHGLMGKTPRSYEKTVSMFNDSEFEILKEVPLEGLPNTFLWILSPKPKARESRI